LILDIGHWGRNNKRLQPLAAAARKPPQPETSLLLFLASLGILAAQRYELQFHA
jgi:hypothetical protein